MKDYYIKHGGYYIQEGETCPHRVLEIEQATSFGSLDSLSTYVTKSMHLNIAHVQVECHEVVKTKLINMQGKWLDSSLTERCAECNIVFPITHMVSGVVDKESGIEFYCEKHQHQDFIVGNCGEVV